MVMWVPLRAARIGVRIGFVAGAPSSPDEPAEPRSATRRIFHYQRPHVVSQPRRRVGGVADLSAVETVIDEVCDPLPQGCVVVNKSTVSVGTAARTAEMLNRLDVTVVNDPNSSAKVPQWKVFCTPTASWWAAMPRTPPSA
jgi:UDP-glucose/GDP-mannose dehydrogenase family, NAD binding domain